MEKLTKEQLVKFRLALLHTKDYVEMKKNQNPYYGTYVGINDIEELQSIIMNELKNIKD